MAREQDKPVNAEPSEAAREAVAKAEHSVEQHSCRARNYEPEDGQTAKLTIRQRKFVLEYLIDLNGMRAAMRAGYAESGAHTEASRLLKNPKVVAALNEERQRLEQRTEMDVEWVLLRLREVVERCLYGKRFDAAGCNRALELIGKHLRMYTDRYEIVNPFMERLMNMNAEQLVELEDEERQRILEGACPPRTH